MENSENHYTDTDQKLQQVEKHLEEVRTRSYLSYERKSVKPPSGDLYEDLPYHSDKSPMISACTSPLKMSPTCVEKISSPRDVSPSRFVRRSFPEKAQESKVERATSPIESSRPTMHRSSSNAEFVRRSQEITQGMGFENLTNFGMGGIGNLPIFPQNQLLSGMFPQMTMPTGNPDQIQRLLLEQAERLEQMVHRMKAPQAPRTEIELLKVENARLKEQLAVLQKIMNDRCVKLEQQNLMLMQQAQRSFSPGKDMLSRQKDQELANLKKELEITKQEVNSLRSQEEMNYRQQQDNQRQLHELERHLYDTQKSYQAEKSKLLTEMNELRRELENLHYSNNSMALEKEKLSEDMKELKQTMLNNPPVNNNQTSDKHLKEINSLKECIKNQEKQINEWSTSYYKLQKDMNQLIMEKHTYGRVSEKYDKSGVTLLKDNSISEEDKVSKNYRNNVSKPASSSPSRLEPRSSYEASRYSPTRSSEASRYSPTRSYESSRYSPTRNLPTKTLTNESSNVSSALIWKDSESKQGYDSQQLLTFPSFQTVQNSTQIITNLEHKLMELQLDYEKLQSEYVKLPENTRNIAKMKKKKDLELEVSIIETNINSIKTKLRKYTAQS